MVDEIGHNTLDVIAEAKGFNKWMYDTIHPYLHGRVLEIGSGIGNISENIIKNLPLVTLSDIDEGYRQILLSKFGHHPNVEDIVAIDLQNINFRKDYQHLHLKFDSVILLNVLEHIKDQALAFSIFNYLLKPGGSLIVLVPAYSFLYCNFDKALSHFRRYTVASLKSVILANQFQPQKIWYFNFIGIAGWFFFGKLLSQKEIRKNNMNIYSKLLPVVKTVDRLLCGKAGLSVVSISKK